MRQLSLFDDVDDDVLSVLVPPNSEGVELDGSAFQTLLAWPGWCRVDEPAGGDAAVGVTLAKLTLVDLFTEDS